MTAGAFVVRRRLVAGTQGHGAGGGPAPRRGTGTAGADRRDRGAARRAASRGDGAPGRLRRSSGWSRAAGGGGLVERIGLIRRQIAAELGLIAPTVRIRDDLVLEPDEYVISLRGSEIARGRVDAARLLCLDPAGGELALDGIPATEPVFGLPALWISLADRERAESPRLHGRRCGVRPRHPPRRDDPPVRRRDPRPARDEPAARRLQGRPRRAARRARPQPGDRRRHPARAPGAPARARPHPRPVHHLPGDRGRRRATTKEPLFLAEAARHALARSISMRHRAAGRLDPCRGDRAGPRQPPRQGS